MMQADLHTHTTASDGTLAPGELLARARRNGVDLLAITDHDTLAAHHELSGETGLTLVRGIELSARWQATGIHVVGLNVDLGAMGEAVALQQQAREVRAGKIAERLERATGHDFLPGAKGEAGDGQIGRPHFARAMVRSGMADDVGDAFRRFLGRGKAGDVREDWPELGTVVGWIRDAGGTAVLAHPVRYRMTNSRLKRLLGDFKAAGGEAMEVVSGPQNRDVTDYLAVTCEQFGLLASCGSDFHSPTAWSEPGRVAELPSGCKPVWDAWQ